MAVWGGDSTDLEVAECRLPKHLIACDALNRRRCPLLPDQIPTRSAGAAPEERNREVDLPPERSGGEGAARQPRGPPGGGSALPLPGDTCHVQIPPGLKQEEILGNVWGGKSIRGRRLQAPPLGDQSGRSGGGPLPQLPDQERMVDRCR